MAELKTKKTNASVPKFIASVKNPKRRADAQTTLKLFKEATGLQPKMWGAAIIGFGQYHYESERSQQKGDWPLVGFSPRAANMTFYIMPGFKEMQPLLEKLGPHTTSTGCLYIKDLAKIHQPTLKALIKRSLVLMKKKHGV